MTRCAMEVDICRQSLIEEAINMPFTKCFTGNLPRPQYKGLTIIQKVVAKKYQAVDPNSGVNNLFEG